MSAAAPLGAEWGDFHGDYNQPFWVSRALDKPSRVRLKPSESDAVLVASANGKAGALRKLLQPDSDGTTPRIAPKALHLACRHGHLKVVQLLVENGADLEARSKLGTALIEAMWSRHMEVAKFLISKGANVNATDKGGWTAAVPPILKAALYGNMEMVQLLIAHGADIHAPALLDWAVHGHNFEIVSMLIDMGLDPLDVDGGGESIVKSVVCEGNLEMLELLIGQGYDILTLDKHGRSLLAYTPPTRAGLACSKLLLDRGLNINNVDAEGHTQLHLTCRNLNLTTETLAFVLERGGKDALFMEDKRGLLPLHVLVCAMANFMIEPQPELVRILCDAGADVNTKTRDGRSTLRLLMLRTDEKSDEIHLKVIRELCSRGAVWDASCDESLAELQREADRSDSGSESDDSAEEDSDSSDGSEVSDEESQEEESQGEESEEDESAGESSSVDDGEEEAEAEEDEDAENDDEDEGSAADGGFLKRFGDLSVKPKHTQQHELITWRQGLRACVHQWERDCHERGPDALTEIPVEVIKQGEHSVHLYLEDQLGSTADQKVSRSKICVVGPSEWGKTSLVKSVTTLQPSLVHIENRTIGIDLFPCSFQEAAVEEEADPKNHEVTFWDFAGQDVYHVAHALFFSKRTLYLLCVDLPVYIEQLRRSEKLSVRVHEAAMVRFVDDHVIRWVETIIVRQPDAEFLIVGTKVDLVEDEKAVEEVWIDLKVRLGVWRDSFAKAATASLLAPVAGRGKVSGSHDALRHRVMELRDKLSRTFRDDWMVVSSVDQASVELARQATESNVISSKRGFVMGSKYNRVLQLIVRCRETAAQGGDAKTRIESLILPSNYLCREMLREIEDLEVEDCVVILRTLHELGDILWYDHYDAGALRGCVILDPLLVIDLVKEVVSHELTLNASTSDSSVSETQLRLLRDEGRMSHELLRAGQLWRHLDEELTQAFKNLLNFFQLAYAADGEQMDWDSDLIVPTYWKIKMPTATQKVPAPIAADDAFKALELGDSKVRAAWEYGIPSSVAETVYDHFAVSSATVLAKRVIANQSITCFVQGEMAAHVSLVSSVSSQDTIRIHVVAADRESAWLNLRYFVMAMETVLDAYTGLLVSREIVEIVEIDFDTQEETRHRVGRVVQELEDTVAMGRDVEELYASRPWLSPDMSWFIEKAWRHPGQLKEIQTRAFTRQLLDKTTALHKLTVRGERGRLLPALWTAQYDETSGQLTLRMLSDLSGVCYHEPIVIDVPASFVAVPGTAIQAGLWICSNVTPEVLTLDVVQKAINLVSSGVSGTVERAQTIHNLIERLDLGKAADATSTKLSPSRARSLLVQLLKLRDAAFDELKFSELANLQCAVSTSGSYVWAHPHEIKAFGEKLIPCEPRQAGSRTTKQPSLASVSTVGELELTLTVDLLEGLSSWDSYKVFCSWQLVHESNSAPLASGTTDPVTSVEGFVSWSSKPFVVSSELASLEMLRECRLEVHVKRASRMLGKLKSLGQGSTELADCKLRVTNSQTLSIAVDGSSPWVLSVILTAQGHASQGA